MECLAFFHATEDASDHIIGTFIRLAVPTCLPDLLALRQQDAYLSTGSGKCRPKLARRVLLPAVRLNDGLLELLKVGAKFLRSILCDLAGQR